MKDYWAATINGGKEGTPDFEAKTPDLLIAKIANYYVDEFEPNEEPNASHFPGLLALYKSMVGDDLIQLDNSIRDALEMEIENEIKQIEEDVRNERDHIKSEKFYI